MSYRCAYGCTRYNPLCDACEGAVADQTTGWAEPEADTKDRFKAAIRGMTLREYREFRGENEEDYDL